MAGVTETGFEAKRLADILTDAESDMSAIVDPASGQTLQPDFGSEDPAMQVVKVPLDAVGTAWEAMQLVSTQFDPTKAVGAFLRGLVQLNGVTAQPASASSVTLALTGTIGTVIVAGQLVSDANNAVQWETLDSVLLDGSGNGTVAARAVTVGPISAAAGTITNIVTPVAGWATVTNPAAAIEGRLAETDTQLRQRRRRSTYAPAASPVEAVYSNLSNVTGVTFARVYQNNTLVTDSRGIPGKSVAAVVVGGEDLDIAYSLLERTGIVAQFYGDESLTLYDLQNEPYDVRWTRPDPVDVYVTAEIRITNVATFPVNGPEQMRENIIAYAAGGSPALGIDDGFGDIGFPPGSLVIQSRLYTPLNYVPGHQVVSLNIGLVPDPTTEDSIQIDWNKYPRFLPENIVITVLE